MFGILPGRRSVVCQGPSSISRQMGQLVLRMITWMVVKSDTGVELLHRDRERLATIVCVDSTTARCNEWTQMTVVVRKTSTKQTR